jgi:hypothetical protein
MAADINKREIDNVIHDPETNTAGFYKPKKTWSFDSEPQLDS